jgi:hypothetical protein
MAFVSQKKSHGLRDANILEQGCCQLLCADERWKHCLDELIGDS